MERVIDSHFTLPCSCNHARPCQFLRIRTFMPGTNWPGVTPRCGSSNTHTARRSSFRVVLPVKAGDSECVPSHGGCRRDSSLCPDVPSAALHSPQTAPGGTGRMRVSHAYVHDVFIHIRVDHKEWLHLPPTPRPLRWPMVKKCAP